MSWRDKIMDIVKLSVPASFIHARTRLTWRDVLYGIDNELLAAGAAVEFAREAKWDDRTPALEELAALGKGEPTRDLVEKLANEEPPRDVGVIREKWLFLVLAWIFAHRAHYPDPLQAVEEVYADFDYPPRITRFVRYMPAEEPDLGSVDLNVQRMHQRWKEYLDEASAEYAPT